MITAIAIVISLFIVIYAITRKSNKVSKSIEYLNQELVDFQNAGDLPAQKLQKLLFLATVTLVEKMRKTNYERYYLYRMAESRLMGYDCLTECEDILDELKIEKMEIAMEADQIVENWSSKIFDDAEAYSANLRKQKPVEKKTTDLLYNKRRGILEKKIATRMASVNQPDNIKI